ncbi:uncharacterized protein LOC114975818 isoform X3 [Acropora millepora]|uniref:uncharacterized protein LOC114975818 isoform X3 n=1 Tax=Acropora millepora TaxID=45264 RepID=UPI001CF54F91|nr:uncharacterized protein LOC114975818 isoform X3 [Acropora millepora]
MRVLEIGFLCLVQVVLKGHAKNVAQSINGSLQAAVASHFTRTSNHHSPSISKRFPTLESASLSKLVLYNDWPFFSVTSFQSDAFSVRVSVSSSTLVMKGMSSHWSSSASISTSVLEIDSISSTSSSTTLSQREKTSNTFHSPTALSVSPSVSSSRSMSKSLSSTLSPSFWFSPSVIQSASETVRPSTSPSLSNFPVGPLSTIHTPHHPQSVISTIASAATINVDQSDLWPPPSVTSSHREAFALSLSVPSSTAFLKRVSSSWSSSASISTSGLKNYSLLVNPSASRSVKRSQSHSQSESLSVSSSTSVLSSDLHSVSREVSSLEFLQSQPLSTRGSSSSSIGLALSASLTFSQIDGTSSSLRSSADFSVSLSVTASRRRLKSTSSTLSPSFSLSPSVVQSASETVHPNASLSLSNIQVGSLLTIHSSGHAQSVIWSVAFARTASLSPSDSVSLSGSYSTSFSHSQSALISRGPSSLERPSKSESVIFSQWPSSSMTSSQSLAFAVSVIVSSSTATVESLTSVSSSWSSSASISKGVSISVRSSIDITVLKSSSAGLSWSIFPSKSRSVSLSTASEILSNLYPYGKHQNDEEFGVDDSFGYYRSTMCLEIKVHPYGLRFFASRHYKLHICRNGIIQTNNKWSLQWPRKFGVSYYVDLIGMLAPFWARSDQYQSFKLGISKVYYHIYDKSQSDHDQTGEILALATKHVEQYGGGRFANFEATWVLVVTWENLCPSVIYRYTYDGNPGISSGICAMRNTFQAVIITDWYNSFLMYNYPHGGIQWAFGVPSSYYKYWTNLYGLPVAGWNDPESGTKLNIKGSGSILGMYNLDKRMGNTDLLGRYFWRIESSDEKGAFENCFSWVNYQRETNFIFWYYWRIRWDTRMACPCTIRQAFLDRGRFYRDWYFSWPEICFRSRRFFYFSYHGFGSQLCCYSTEWEDFGALKIGPPEGGHISVTRYNTYYGKTEVPTDTEAYNFCCVEGFFCDFFYQYRPSDTCQFYRPPPRPWFWGDPHIRTLDGGNYTFNGLGEYVMLDAQSGTFQLQARTGLARGNSTTGTIFVAGAAKEENTTTVEVRIKKDGGLHILFGGKLYSNFSSLTNQSVETAGNLSISKSEEDCLEVSFPSTTSVIFCARKEMLSFVVSPGDDYKNSTKGLLGTWNDNMTDDFLLPDGTVLSPSSTAREIHFGFGVKWQISQSQSLFTYAQNENTSTYAIPDFLPMFGDNITWQNDTLRKQAEDVCGSDNECLFDVAATNDLDVGQATKDIGNQLSKELKTLDNFPPKILNVPISINVTLEETFMINITAQDSDTVTFQVVNKPDSAIVNQSENVLRFTWPVTSSRQLNLSFVATDDQGAAATWKPSIHMCVCEHGGQCVPPENGDPVNKNSKFVYMGCACQGGYTGRFCDSEIDACEVNGQPCYEDVVCTDLPPPANETGYICEPCPSGFTGNGAECSDFDECQSNQTNSCSQLCINAPGSYFCACQNGYSLNDDKESCDDINECVPSSDCMQRCHNTQGSYNCSCDESFKRDPSDWRKCIAINPCELDLNCSQVCYTDNNNTATCACFANYELQSDGKSCLDIDECNSANHLTLCDHICENIPGSYKCSCKKGFNLINNRRCEDIDECIDEDYFNCTDPLQRCVNTPGSYKCECEKGLQLIDGKCQDIDECNSTKPLTPCDQICENIPGSYKCSCQKGFNLVNGSRCEDIDECNSTNPLHRCEQICENVPGSYKCSCQKGFNLVTGSRCEDIDECNSTKPLTPCDQICENIPGSYNCSCQKGFNLINGFRCEAVNVYPYGEHQSDQEFGVDDLFGYYRSIMCLEIKVQPYGLRFFGARHYKLHICRNGKIQTNSEWSVQWPRKFGVSYYVDTIGMFAPFWARSDQYQSFESGISKVYYHIYEKSQGDHDQTSKILALASKHVEQYVGGRFASFTATWVLVVTWENLCPSVIYRYLFDGNQEICALKNTFQAVIITDWYNSFLMYNYPRGGIQWAAGVPFSYYKYWTNLYGLPVAGWNEPQSGTKLNIKGSGTILGMYNLDKKMGNTDLVGRYFWRIESSDGKGAFEKCFSWVNSQIETNFIFWYYWSIRWDSRMACPCTLWQAFLDRGRFYWDWQFTWPEVCFRSRRSVYFSYQGRASQLCCYSTEWEDFGALKIGSPEGGHISVTRYNTYYGKTEVLTDTEAYKFCCVEGFFCDFFYQYRPSDTCQFYQPPPRPWFWGDPHIRTLDGGNYTFNGLGEYVMLDAESGTFQLQARTGLAQGNSTTGTVFVAGAAKEENTTTVEVRIKKDGGLHILFGGTLYSNFSSLTNQSIETAGNLSISKSEKNCLEVSFPSTTSVIFCARKEMLSFVVSPGDDYKNRTKGLLGTWNDNTSDDFTLPDGTVLSPSSTDREIHFGFGVKWQINHSQSLFTYAQNETASTFAIPDFLPMFGDNITWQSDALRKQAEDVCGSDKECLYDVASTNDLSVGQATKDIGNQLSKELKTLDNFPPKILNVPSSINVTLEETFMINITAQDSDTVTFQIVNKPDSAIVNQSENVLRFMWPVTSSRQLNLSFVATDDQGAAATWNPSINMCACEHRGQCVSPEDGDPVNTNSKFVYMGCTCQGGYTGRFCDSEIDACEVNGQPCYEDVVCTDLPPPANETGYTCGPCPSGFTGNGAECSDFDECQSNQTNSCSQLCINAPGSYSCACQNGYSLNDDKESCDDINECEPSSNCMQRCLNTQGSYNCSCEESFETDPTDWRKCIAKNPCKVGHNCSQVCYTDNNNTTKCACFANFELQSDGKTCRDIDECNFTNHLTRCDQICENILGSYKCSCEKGFNLVNSYRCEDINECIDEDYFNCTDPRQHCVNTPGSYKCECEMGLQQIDGKCQDIDECSSTNHLTRCDQICENILGSYKCSCQEGFNLVNGFRCEVLEKNETVIVPELPTPRAPSKDEREQAVKITVLANSTSFKWDFHTDRNFKEKLASFVSSFCSVKRKECAIKETSRERRAHPNHLYTAKQVHLLPGYPSNASGSLKLQIAVYVQQPLEVSLGNVPVLPSNTLLTIILLHKSELGASIGAIILDAEVLFKPTTSPPTSPQTEDTDSGYTGWLMIAACLGAVLIFVVIILAICIQRRRNRGNHALPQLRSYASRSEDIVEMSFYNITSKEYGKDCEDGEKPV